jgi:hypothetical protein
LKEYVDKCQQIIQKYGWMVQGIGGGPATNTWAYTVGLTGTSRELVIVGMDLGLAQRILNDAAKHKDMIIPDSLVDVGWSVQFLVQEVSSRPLSMVRILYDQFADTALQLIWPDASGSYNKSQQVIP